MTSKHEVQRQSKNLDTKVLAIKIKELKDAIDEWEKEQYILDLSNLSKEDITWIFNLYSEQHPEQKLVFDLPNGEDIIFGDCLMYEDNYGNIVIDAE